MSPIEKTRPRRLSDCCSETIAFGLMLRKSPDPGDGERLRIKIGELLSDMDREAREAGVASEGIDLAKYALVAFLDEIVLNSTWPLKDAWLGNPLQMEHFNDFAAGEQFFAKVDLLLQSELPYKAETLEVFHLVMALGFRGKHTGLQGMEAIKELNERIATELGSPPTKALSQPLATHWEAPGALPKAVKEFPVWALVVGCAALLVALYVTFATSLGSATGDVLKILR